MISQLSKKSFIILLTLFFFFLYILLKLILLFTQDLFMNHEVYDKKYNIGDVWNIQSEYSGDRFQIKFNDNHQISTNNYFSNYTLEDHDNNYYSYVQYGEDNLVQSVFMVGQYDTQLYNINNYSEESYYYEFNHFPLYISDHLKKHYLKKYQINDDVDLVKFIRSRKKIQCNFFTPVIKMKENYFFNFVELSLPNLDEITYVEGDLNGYIVRGEDYKRVFLLKNGKLYCLTFHKLNYFTDEKIKEILKSVSFE